MNWYPRYPGDYARDTADLTLAEHGAYSLLLDHYYSTKGDIPKEITAVIRICRAFEDYEKEAVKVVLDRFFPVDEYGNRTNKRADKEQDKSKGIKEVRSAAGAVGAAKKWGECSSKEKRSTRLAKAREKARHTKEEWDAMVLIHSHKCCKCGSIGDRGGIVKDHILPIYQGGSDGIDNLQPLCTSCNSSKGSDNQDYRQIGWQNALQNALQTPAIPQPQPQPHPETRNQKPETTSKSAAKPLDVGFESFWNIYPKKVGKAAALKAWQKAKGKPDIDAIIKAVKEQTDSDQWRKENGQFVPNPATWLNQGRWDDRVVVDIQPMSRLGTGGL